MNRRKPLKRKRVKKRLDEDKKAVNWSFGEYSILMFLTASLVYVVLGIVYGGLRFLIE